MFQIYAGLSKIKKVKNLREIREKFEESNVLKPEELLNVVLVKPCGHLRLPPLNVIFEGGEGNIENRVRQCTLGLQE